jgi:putative oxidoreductase
MDHPSSSLPGLRLFCQVAVGLLLLYAGGQKLFVSGVVQFMSDVEKFQILPASLVPLVAYLMPWWEVVTGLCLMLDVMRKGALFSALLMTLFFCGVIGWAWHRGLDISCGCFGKSDATIHYPKKSVELLLQLAALIFASSGPVLVWREMDSAARDASRKKS